MHNSFNFVKRNRSQIMSQTILHRTAVFIAGALAFSTVAFAQGDRDNYVSDASFIVGTYQPDVKERNPQAMADAANKFLETLSDEQKTKVMHKLDSNERRQWTNLPARPDAGGLRLGDCNDDQVRAACLMMATMFSEYGYKKMCNIMIGDDQLLQGGRRQQGIGTVDFSIVLFATPDPKQPWAFQIDGHHLGVNLAIEGENLSLSPSFVGNQPYDYKIANESYAPMDPETKLAHKLINALPEELREKAVVSNRNQNLRVGPGRDGNVPQARGVECGSFNDEQKKIVIDLIQQWVNLLPEKQAAERMKEIESQLNETRFAWNGDTPSGSDISYEIQGPSLIIEYACQGRGGNPTDHLHSIYRNPKNEYGNQLK
jgi:hypothetical protein